MSAVLDRNNLLRALKQVTRNKGSAGIDGLRVDALPAYLKLHWSEIIDALKFLSPMGGSESSESQPS